ncbi:CBS domain-containing protein [Thermoproteus tenax]|uniref:CBS domain n=1 Tax=Thermoproteus tenax (strain ATCC 35583 / DSM 2078 / JCM 9277 / NBRC 100435 / Kra 1) TaxID=768679 RepID=G4RP51_THETK|nr:CBS domain-containing protein [Thermoproteus tenax]CCC81346.1 CBS domain [Thermoproteus tenax Kra 1]
MKAIDIAKEVPSIAPNSTVLDAAKALVEAECAVVLDGEEPVGVITEYDIVRAVAQNTPPDAPVVEIITAPPLLVEGHEPLWKVAEAFIVSGNRFAAVTSGGRFIGVVSASDIADEDELLSDAASFAELTTSYAPAAD